MATSQNAVNPNVISRSHALFQEFNRNAHPNNIQKVATRGETDQKKVFPVQLGTADPDDLAMSLRSQVIDGDGKVPNMGQAIADDRVFNYLQRKKEAAIEADYRAWVMSQANFSDPAQSQWWTEKFPWIRNLKIAQIEQDADLQKRLAIIKVTGPQSEEDFKLMYELQQGYRVMPSKPVHELNEDEKWVGDSNFVRGLFNPLTRTPTPGGFPKQTRIPSNWMNPFDFSGNATGEEKINNYNTIINQLKPTR